MKRAPFKREMRIGKRPVGAGHPAYIIAEIGSNFDGSLARAKRLARLCKAAGADAFKIQNFTAPKIVSDIGFKNLRVAFQAKWDKPVVEVYRAAEFPRAWLKAISDYCRKIGIDFFSSPYDTEAVDLLERIDGTRTLGEIAHGRDVVRVAKFFEKLWRCDQVVFDTSR